MSSADPTTALTHICAGTPARELEGDTLDFKEEAGDPKKTIKDLVSASVCFANATGGTIVLGVKDNVGGPAALSGARLPTSEARTRIFEQTKPPLLVDVSERLFHVGDTKVRLLEVRVPNSTDVHSDSRGRFTLRVGSDCLPMDSTQQAAAHERKASFDWSAQERSLQASDVSAAAEGVARDRLRTLSDFRSGLAELSTADLLRALGVVGNDGRLVAAAEVLFVPADESGVPRVVYQYRDTPGGEPSTVERLYGPVVSVLARVMELVQARRKLTPVTLPTGQQLQVEDFPELAIREAIANGLFHRDYQAGGSVVVDHSPEVFVVSSPGPLPAGITPDNILTHPSRPRNARLTHAAQILGLVEEVGRGVDRMYREMVRSGQGVPTIEDSGDRVRVTFVGGAPNTQLARYVAELPDTERNDVDTMLVLFSLCSMRTISIEQAAPLLQKSSEEASVVLRRLASDAVGLLEPTRQTAARTRRVYRLRGEALKALGSAVSYQRRTTDDIDRKIIDHVREYEKVTNRTVRNLLDVGTDRAAAILGGLVKRGVLVKTSEARRGPSVEYGPGPDFPPARPARRRRRAPLSSR